MGNSSSSTVLTRRLGWTPSSFLEPPCSRGSKIGSRATASKTTLSGRSTTTPKWSSQRTWKWNVPEWRRFVVTNWESRRATPKTRPTTGRRTQRPWATTLQLGPNTVDISTNERTRIAFSNTETATGLSVQGWSPSKNASLYSRQKMWNSQCRTLSYLNIKGWKE